MTEEYLCIHCCGMYNKNELVKDVSPVRGFLWVCHCRHTKVQYFASNSFITLYMSAHASHQKKNSKELPRKVFNVNRAQRELSSSKGVL